MSYPDGTKFQPGIAHAEWLNAIREERDQRQGQNIVALIAFAVAAVFAGAVLYAMWIML